MILGREQKMHKTLSHIKIQGRDELTLLGATDASGKTLDLQIKAIGCLPLLSFVQKWRDQLAGKELAAAPVPHGPSHPEMLVRELIRQAQGHWHPPYTDEEICHCRLVPTNVVIDAIRAGAQTNAEVSAMTSATTACGTCGPDVRRLIDYFRGKSPS